MLKVTQFNLMSDALVIPVKWKLMEMPLKCKIIYI